MATADMLNQQVVTKSDVAVGTLIKKLLRPLASLRLTVSLLAMSVFLVLAGTMAQVNKDIWQVVDEYFRCEIAWIDFQIFFPPSFIPSQPDIWDWLVIPFPGGRLIGTLMFLNLIAAHGIRFKTQASGTRLWSGVGVIGLGVLTTWLVVVSGSNPDGLQHESWVSWETLWTLCKLGLTTVWAGLIYGAFRATRSEWQAANSQMSVVTRVVAAMKTSLHWNFGSCVLGIVLIWLWWFAARLDDSSMRILWQLIKATFAGLVLLVGCVMVFKKRAGVVLLHGGIGLMMFSELLVGLTAVEAQISLEEGEKANFARDIRAVELAIVQSPDAESEKHVVVPGTKLVANGNKITHELLPFDLEVLEIHKNAMLRPVSDEHKAVATHGMGLKRVLLPAEASTGVDSGGNVDYPAAYVRLTKRGSGEDLGTYLVAVRLSEQGMSDTVTLDGQTIDLSLRFRRNYKPYTVELLDTGRTDYLGTNTARDFHSDIRVVDESRGKDFEYHVWMNNPLRYAGETFYQSSHGQFGGKEFSTLQVVTNSGWMIPYVACMIVAIGMMAHFLITLTRFLDRRSRESAPVAGAPRESLSGAAKWVPIVFVAFLALWVFGKARVPEPKSDQYDYAALGKLPVVMDGRVKPLDTYARNMLRILSGSETFKREVVANGKTKLITEPAIRFLIDAMARPDDAKHYPVLRIENLEVLQALNLQRRKGFRYSFAEITEQPDEKETPFEQKRVIKLGEKTNAARKKGTRNLSVEERKALEFEKKFGQYLALTRFGEIPESSSQSPIALMQRAMSFHTALKNAKLPFVLPPLTDDDDQWDYLTLGELLQPLDSQPEHRWLVKVVSKQLDDALLAGQLDAEENEQLSSARQWLAKRYPDVEKIAKDDMEALTKGQARPANPAVAAWRDILAQYQANDVSKFNVAVRGYRDSLKSRNFGGVGMSLVSYEWFFNFFQGFVLASMLYFFAFLTASVSWLSWFQTLNRTAFGINLLAFVLHTFALVSRMLISGRPPVTNLYSSAVFIGWGIVLLGLVYEWLYRNGIGNIVSAASGFATLLIAHFLSGDGDTFTVLVAVLDTQFWLATHVTTINLGYATTFLSGMMGLMYLALRTPFRLAYAMSAVLALSCVALPSQIAETIEAFTDVTLATSTVKWGGLGAGVIGLAATAWLSRQPKLREAAPLTDEREKNLARMVYGTLCFGIFFSFVGTVLGGLWADDSWGRFWGWDPKENGALIIVLWNALVLHARWGGMVKNRGLAVLSIGGNIATSWSWFGVNELGVGLHSYGFTEGVLLALGLFVLSQLAVIVIGCLPKDPPTKLVPADSSRGA